MLTLLFVLAIQTPAPPTPYSKWNPLTADLRITHPDGKERSGKFIRDEHGCTRREIVTASGERMIDIQNFANEKFYQLRGGAWTAQPMRVGPARRRLPPSRARLRPAPEIDGYEAWIAPVQRQTPGGDEIREVTILPALNDFEAVQRLSDGETIAAFNIQIPDESDHTEFLPPSGATLTERPEPGGFIPFNRIAIALDDATSVRTVIETAEDTPRNLTVAGTPLFVVTKVVDESKSLVRVRILSALDPTRSGTVEGTVLEEVVLAPGERRATTKLERNLTLTITAIGDRSAK